MEMYDERPVNPKYRPVNPKYQEILKLHELLSYEKIPHNLHRFFDGWQVVYYDADGGYVMDAIEHSYSYGERDDLIEIMGLLTEEEEKQNSVKGNLTAIDVYKRIRRHYWMNREG